MKHLLFFFFSLFFTTSNAQSSEWIISAGGKHADCGSALARDEDGFIYLAGSFQGEATFNDTTLYSNGDTDVFLAKYEEKGNLVWIKQAGSNFTKRNAITEYPTAIRVHEDAVYMIGVFAGIADFNTTKIISKGKEDLFLAKYNLEGKLLWVKRAGGSSQDIPNDLIIDKSGNIYITGSYQKTADFAPKRQLTARNNRNLFIAKYSSEGELDWIKSSYSQTFSIGKAIETDKEGIIVAGDFAGEIQLDDTKLSSNGSTDIFIVKYDFEGNQLWATQHGSTGMDQVNAISCKDGIYLAGSYLTTARSESWQSKGARDGFVSKLTANGNQIWNKTIGGTENDEIIAMSIKDGQLIIAGKYNADFEYDDEEVYLSNGFTDIFLLKMDLFGNTNDIKVMGGSGQDFPTSMLINDDEILMTGLYRNQLTTTQTSSGGSDIFLSGLTLNFDHENELKVIYLVYPNPTENNFWIRSEEKFNEIELIQQDGRRIEFKNGLNTNEYRFELSDLPTGVYYVRIDGNSVKKLIIL